MAAPSTGTAGTGTSSEPIAGTRPAPVTPTHVVPSRRSFIEPILKRNIFDSTAVGATSASQEGVVSGEGRRTDLKVTLLATIVAEPEEHSSCLIATDDKSARCAVCGYGIGDDLLGEATIVRIEQKKVIIRRTDGTVEYIDMDGAANGKRGVGSNAADETAEGVTKTGENSYVVDSSLVSDALSNIDKLATQVRAIPHRGTDGEVDGYRLSAIRRGSLLNKLGIKNGDIIHSVNGIAITSASAAMSAYNSLQNEKSFTFEITRRNQKQTLTYEIR